MTDPRKDGNTENAEPHEQNNPVPRVLIGLIAALALWAVYYIYASSPNSVAGLGDHRSVAALSAGASVSEGAPDGKQLFTTTCQACHQATGQGLPGVFPPLAGAPWVTGDPHTLAKIVLHGLTGPVEVAGTTYNGAMPAFGNQLGDAELAAVLSYIRNEWGNSSPAIEHDTVAAARKATAGRTEPWKGTKELMEQASSGAGQ
jgi:mono/diheme cytochrome c family protein